MTRRPTLPPQLLSAPFSLQEARAAGLTLSALKSSAWIRLGNELYCWRGLHMDPWLLLAAWHRNFPELIFSGRSAAWMHGLDYQPVNPAEAIAPPSATSRTRSGISVRRCEVPAEDVVTIGGLAATSVNRTLLDFCIAANEVEALVAIDMALYRGRTDPLNLARYANELTAIAGCVRLKRLAALGERAESPMETRLRWLLVGSGLARPQVQVDLHDRFGSFIARSDLYYPSARLVVEFDGGNHKNRLIADNRRQNDLISAGFTVLRFTTADLESRPQNVVAQVRGVLAAPRDSTSLTSQEPFTALRSAPVTSDGRNAGQAFLRPYLRNR